MPVLLDDLVPLAVLCVLIGLVLRRLVRTILGVLGRLVVLVALAVVLGTLFTTAAPRTERAPRPCAESPKAVLTVYRFDMPAIAAHIVAAQRSDPAWRVLCRNGLNPNVDEPKANRRVSICGRVRAPRAGESCDEYPFASTYEGGEYASFAIVPVAENDLQGRQLSAFYWAHGVQAGDTFLVVVV
jgi:hypothetical protein